MAGHHADDVDGGDLGGFVGGFGDEGIDAVVEGAAEFGVVDQGDAGQKGGGALVILGGEVPDGIGLLIRDGQRCIGGLFDEVGLAFGGHRLDLVAAVWRWSAGFWAMSRPINSR